MVLGELTYQRLSGEMRFVKDPQLVNYISSLGAKLINHLPPTGLTFHFFIVDIPEANAFDVPGGYVFISRKLIGFANNEDELAGGMKRERRSHKAFLGGSRARRLLYLPAAGEEAIENQGSQ